MTKIAIDLNDVIRDYTNNFVRTYLLNYNREFDTSDLVFWTNDMQSLLPFKTERAYERFTYEDFSYDLFGKCDTCSRKTTTDINSFLEYINNLEEEVEVILFSPMEIGPTIGYTLFFLSKLGSNIREIYFPKNSLTIWDKSDIVITANPYILENKPEDKISVKINFDYNREVNADYSFTDFSAFVKDENNINKIINYNE